jgi:hypothetical protein
MSPRNHAADPQPNRNLEKIPDEEKNERTIKPMTWVEHTTVVTYHEGDNPDLLSTKLGEKEIQVLCPEEHRQETVCSACQGNLINKGYNLQSDEQGFELGEEFENGKPCWACKDTPGKEYACVRKHYYTTAIHEGAWLISADDRKAKKILEHAQDLLQAGKDQDLENYLKTQIQALTTTEEYPAARLGENQP